MGASRHVLIRLAVAVVASAAAATASAGPVDIADTVEAIQNGLEAVTSVATACGLIYVGLAGFKFIKRAMT